MIQSKTLHIETSEAQYRVELEIDVNVTPSDYSCDNSDIDYYGCTELLGYEINFVQIRTGIEKSPVARQKKDWLRYKSPNLSESYYNWMDVLMEDLSPEEQEELNEQINKEIMHECNC